MTIEPLAVSRPYRASWFDALKAFVDRSRLPSWAWYALGALIPAAAVIAANLAAGSYAPGTINVFHVFQAVLPATALGFMHYLDRVAERALEQTAPKLTVDREALERLRYELTTMPALPTLLASIAGVLVALLTVASVLALDTNDQLLSVFGFTRAPVSLGTFVVVVAAGYAVGGPFLLHTFRQLGLIRHIYQHDVVVDLVDLGPVYAFSRVTAVTALGIQIQADLWIVTNPAAAGAIVPVLAVVGVTILAGVVFVVPLWGIHRRITAVKGASLSVNAGSRDVLMASLREGIAGNELGGATQIKDGVLALDVEAKALSAIRTWPWEPETLRLVLTAVLLPTALFVVQYVVRALLGLS